MLSPQLRLRVRVKLEKGVPPSRIADELELMTGERLSEDEVIELGDNAPTSEDRRKRLEERPRRMRKKRCVQMRKSGVPARVIAEELGISRSTVSEWCFEAGMEKKGGGSRMSDDRKAAVLEDYLDPDLSMGDLCARHNVSRRTVQTWRKEAGLPVKKPTGDYGRSRVSALTKKEES